MAEIDYVKIEHIVDRAIQPVKDDITDIKRTVSKDRETITLLQVDASRNTADIIWLKRVNWLLLTAIIGEGISIGGMVVS